LVSFLQQRSAESHRERYLAHSLEVELRIIGPAQAGEGAAALRQAHDEQVITGGEEAACTANRRRPNVRMSGSPLVRTAA